MLHRHYVQLGVEDVRAVLERLQGELVRLLHRPLRGQTPLSDAGEPSTLVGPAATFPTPAEPQVGSGKGANALEKRPQLRLALEHCKKTGATLLIAKLDRLARNVHFVSGLIETGVDFIAADMPNANKVMIQMHAVMSECERDQISERTRAALAAAKARGVVLGATGPQNLRRHVQERQALAEAFRARLQPVLEAFMGQGMSQRAMVTQLNNLGIAAPRGGLWSYGQVQRLTRIPLPPNELSWRNQQGVKAQF